MTTPEGGNAHHAHDPEAYDVVVVGFGPVGQTLTTLLAQHGHRVAVVERWDNVYPKPRAVGLDDEVARIFAGAGIAGHFDDFGQPLKEYVWRNADGKTLLYFKNLARAISGWPSGMTFSQPMLEKILADRATSFPSVTVYRTTEAVSLSEHDNYVEVSVQPTPEDTLHAAGAVQRSGSSEAPPERLRASYVVGCDGANSFVRSHMGVTSTDLGLSYDWLICDVIENNPRTWVPDGLQICDPRRPTTLVSGGPNRRRWEFMKMPSDSAEEFETTDYAWKLLAAWDITPQNARLEKHAVYTFRARWADEWQSGRLFIAGDAAHLMPPFAGQGMCSGIRDAANLAWKLHLVLRRSADPALLGTYSSERSAHVQFAMLTSVNLCNVICTTDPDEVAARDSYMLAVGPDPSNVLPETPPARLGPGALQTDTTGALVEHAGIRACQGRVTTVDGKTGLLDEVFGVGFHVLVDASRAAGSVVPEQDADLITDLAMSVIRLVPATDAAPPDGVADVEGVMLDHLKNCGHAIQIVRPDGYVFGGVAEPSDFPALLADLASALSIRRRAKPGV